MKAKKRNTRWFVYRYGGNSYEGTRSKDCKPERVTVNSHCYACAKADILAKYGGKVDLRGWHMQGLCGAYLKAMQRAVDSEQNFTLKWYCGHFIVEAFGDYDDECAMEFETHCTELDLIDGATAKCPRCGAELNTADDLPFIVEAGKQYDTYMNETYD